MDGGYVNAVDAGLVGLGRSHRGCQDERKTIHVEAMVKFAMIWLMAARLAGEELPEPRSDIEKKAARRLAEDLND